MKDLSIDLETMATTPDAMILSIGAAWFDRDTGEVQTPPFYRVIIITAGPARKMDPSTVQWWLLQSEPARLAVAGKDLTGSCTLADALDELSVVIESGVERVWGNGTMFDLSILEDAYRQIRVRVPWHYRAPRDMRTLVDAAQALGFDPQSISFKGDMHRADHDAVHQARVISAAWRRITRQDGFDR